MPGKKLIVTGSVARSLNTPTPDEHLGHTRNISRGDGENIPKLPMLRTKPRTRLRKSPDTYLPDTVPEVVPLALSEHRCIKERMDYRQLYGTKPAFQLPDINDKPGSVAVRVQPKTRQLNVNDEDSVIFPPLVSTGESRFVKPPRSPAYCDLPEYYDPTASPPPSYFCDPSREYRDAARDGCNLPPLHRRDTVGGYRMLPHPPSQPAPPKPRKPGAPNHLPPINPRKSGGRRF